MSKYQHIRLFSRANEREICNNYSINYTIEFRSTMENFEACLMITRSRLKVLKHWNTATDNKKGNGEKCPMVFFLQEIDLGITVMPSNASKPVDGSQTSCFFHSLYLSVAICSAKV